MKTSGKLKLTIYLLGFAGAALFTILLVRQGAMSVGAAIATAGWAIAGIAAFHLSRSFSMPLPGMSFFRKPFARAGKVCFGCAGSANRSAI